MTFTVYDNYLHNFRQFPSLISNNELLKPLSYPKRLSSDVDAYLTVRCANKTYELQTRSQIYHDFHFFAWNYGNVQQCHWTVQCSSCLNVPIKPLLTIRPCHNGTGKIGLVSSLTETAVQNVSSNNQQASFAQKCLPAYLSICLSVCSFCYVFDKT